MTSIVKEKQVDMQTIVSMVKFHIEKIHKTTVAEYAREHKKVLGISPSSLESYLSGGAVSFPVMKKVYEHLGLGSLRKQTTVKVSYFVEKK